MGLRWDAISGHAGQKASLRTMLREGRLPHALLFAGPDGIGKRMLGHVLAAAILCDSQEGPCGHCESCRAMQLGSHPDYLEVVPEQNMTFLMMTQKKDAGTYTLSRKIRNIIFSE